MEITGANIAFIRRVYFGKNNGTHPEVFSPREIKGRFTLLAPDLPVPVASARRSLKKRLE